MKTVNSFKGEGKCCMVFNSVTDKNLKKFCIVLYSAPLSESFVEPAAVVMTAVGLLGFGSTK